MRRLLIVSAALIGGLLCPSPLAANDVHVQAAGPIGLGYVSLYYGLADPATGQWYTGMGYDPFGGTYETRTWMAIADTGASACLLGKTTQEAYVSYDGAGIPLQPYPQVKFVDEGFGGSQDFAVTEPLRLMIADFKTADDPLNDPEDPSLYTAYGPVGGPTPPSIHLAASLEPIGSGAVDVDIIGMSVMEGRVLQVDPHYLQFMRLTFLVMAGSLERPAPPAWDPRAMYLPVTLEGFFQDPQPVEVGRHAMLPVHIRHGPADAFATRMALFDTGSPVNFVAESFAAEAGIDLDSPPDLLIPVSGVGSSQSERPGWYVDALALDLGRGREGDRLVLSNTAVFTIPDELMPGELQAILGGGVFSPGVDSIYSLIWNDTPVLEWYLDTRDPEHAYIIVVMPDPVTAPGDANLDGRVSISDLGILADNYGLATGANWSQGDFNGDGEVGVADLAALADNYGYGGGGVPAGGGDQVPEPGCLLALLVGGGALVLVRRGRRRRRPLRAGPV